MKTILQREPALILAAVQAILAVAVGFGAPVSTEQAGLIMAAAAALLGLITRSKVTPTSTVAAVDDSGSDTPPAVTAGPAASGIPEGAPVDVVQSSDTKADAAYHDPKHAADE